MIGSLPPQRGVSQYTYDLACELAQHAAVKLEVLAFRSLYPRRFYPGGDPEDRNAVAATVPGARTRRHLRWSNPFGWLFAGATMRGDIVHAQWWSFPLAPVYVVLLAIARLRGKRVVVTVHNAEPHERGVLRRVANRAVLPFAHRIIVHTQQNADALCTAGVARDRISVVPIGVGELRRVTEDDRGAARARLNVAPDTPVVLFHGNIRPYKGLSVLLQAFRSVVAAIPEARLFVAGQPWGPADEVRAEIRSLGLEDHVVTRLEYLPAQALDDLFAATDVVAYSYTHFDAQSAAACDAIRYGKAIIVTSVGGLPDLVRDPLAVVPPRRPDALANAIIGVLRDTSLRAALEHDAQTLAGELSWARVAAMTVDVYRAVADGRSAGVSPARDRIDEGAAVAREATWR
jgi:glycosyltransferase involved in cell wall biosynthesis